MHWEDKFRRKSVKYNMSEHYNSTEKNMTGDVVSNTSSMHYFMFFQCNEKVERKENTISFD